MAREPVIDWFSPSGAVDAAVNARAATRQRGRAAWKAEREKDARRSAEIAGWEPPGESSAGNPAILTTVQDRRLCVPAFRRVCPSSGRRLRPFAAARNLSRCHSLATLETTDSSCWDARAGERKRQGPSRRFLNRRGEASTKPRFLLVVIGDFSQKFVPRGGDEACALHFARRRASANTSSAEYVCVSPRSNDATRSSIS